MGSDCNLVKGKQVTYSVLSKSDYLFIYPIFMVQTYLFGRVQPMLAFISGYMVFYKNLVKMHQGGLNYIKYHNCFYVFYGSYSQ